MRGHRSRGSDRAADEHVVTAEMKLSAGPALVSPHYTHFNLWADDASHLYSQPQQSKSEQERAP